MEEETVQCSFLRLRPSGDRVLPLAMRLTFSLGERGWAKASEGGGGEVYIGRQFPELLD